MSCAKSSSASISSRTASFTVNNSRQRVCRWGRYSSPSSSSSSHVSVSSLPFLQSSFRSILTFCLSSISTSCSSSISVLCSPPIPTSWSSSISTSCPFISLSFSFTSSSLLSSSYSSSSSKESSFSSSSFLSRTSHPKFFVHWRPISAQVFRSRGFPCARSIRVTVIRNSHSGTVKR